MKKKMHLVGMMMNSVMNHTVLGWRHPESKQGTDFVKPQFWQECARTLERGKFDGIFFADLPGAPSVYKDSMETSIKHGIFFPYHDIVVLAPYLASATEKLGIAITISTNTYQPYLASRTLSTLDHLTNGRIGWNVVTGHQLSEYRNLGLNTYIPHDERYERAEEYLEVCHKLWNSWEPDAVVMDIEEGIYTNSEKVHPINHEGKYFVCDGPLPVLPSPQGHPVIFQAGSSGRGRDFAAKNAEATFSVQMDEKSMRKFSDDMRERVQKFGKKPEDFKILFGVQPIVGNTEEEAKAKLQELINNIPLEAALTRLSGSLGYDFSKVDPNEELQYIKTDGSQGFFEMFTKMHGKSITVAEAARVFASSTGFPQIVGTPNQVADQLEFLWEEGGGDGFIVTPPYAPESWTEFVDKVVPELQDRGVFRKEYAGQTFRDHLLEK